jgi:hypothetical protein
MVVIDKETKFFHDRFSRASHFFTKLASFMGVYTRAPFLSLLVNMTLLGWVPPNSSSLFSSTLKLELIHNNLLSS